MTHRVLHGILLATLLVAASCQGAAGATAEPAAVDRFDDGAGLSGQTGPPGAIGGAGNAIQADPAPGGAWNATAGALAPSSPPEQGQRDRDRASQTTRATGGAVAALSALAVAGAGFAVGRRG